jgi:uncharacterized protein YcbX
VIITALAIYPIKSCQGVALQEAVVTRRGLLGDRLWMVVDEHGKLISQRTQPRLTHVAARFEGDAIIVSAKGAPDLGVPRTTEGPRMEAEVWKYRGPAVVHEPGSAWFSRVLDQRALLLHMPADVTRGLDARWGLPGEVVGFADEGPVHLITEESLADASERVGWSLPVARFRPNVVVRGAARPYEEDRWRSLRLSGAALRLVKRCGRCVMTTIDPVSGERGPEPLRTLTTYRAEGGNVYFGVYLAPEAEGAVIRVGDPVEVVDAAP